MARAIPEAILTGTLEVCPRPPWLVQCLQDVEVLVQVQRLFYGLAKAESVGSSLEVCLSQLPHPRTQLWQAHTVLRIHFTQQCLAWYTTSDAVLACYKPPERAPVNDIVQVIVAFKSRLNVAHKCSVCRPLRRTVSEQKDPLIEAL
jgi:hypothetical protein